MTPYDPQKHHRRSIRLKGYDYSQPGAYFVTLVTWQRACLFGEIEGETMRLNPVGEVVQHAWLRLPSFFSIRLDAYTLMPNHFHGIIWMGEASASKASQANKIFSADASPQHATGPACAIFPAKSWRATTARCSPAWGRGRASSRSSFARRRTKSRTQPS